MPEWARDPAGGMIGTPRPQPWPHALFKVGDDPVGDPAINIGAGVGGHFLISYGLEEQRGCSSARRRDQGVQAERGFAGTRLHGAVALAKAEEAGRKPLAARRGLAPKPGVARAGRVCGHHVLSCFRAFVLFLGPSARGIVTREGRDALPLLGRAGQGRTGDRTASEIGVAILIVPMQCDARGVSRHEIKYIRRIWQNQPDDDNDSSRGS